MPAISEGVLHLPEVLSLNLQNNKISDRGLKNLMPSLQANLKQIDLSGNRFSFEGCRLLA